MRPRAFGGPEVLDVVEKDAPVPGHEEVVVEVRVAGVNPFDWKLHSGAFHEVDDDEKDAAGLSGPMPSLGMDAAGVVEAVGPLRPQRDRRGRGHRLPVTAANADRVVFRASSLVRKPDGPSWREEQDTGVIRGDEQISVVREPTACVFEDEDARAESQVVVLTRADIGAGDDVRAPYER